MRNPWEEIRLEDYEEHMALDSVRQLQALNGIMKAQMEAYPVKTVMILGIAGGNGEGILFKKGQVLRKMPEKELLDALLEEVEKL